MQTLTETLSISPSDENSDIFNISPHERELVGQPAKYKTWRFMVSFFQKSLNDDWMPQTGNPLISFWIIKTAQSPTHYDQKGKKKGLVPGWIVNMTSMPFCSRINPVLIDIPKRYNLEITTFRNKPQECLWRSIMSTHVLISYMELYLSRSPKISFAWRLIFFVKTFWFTL